MAFENEQFEDEEQIVDEDVAPDGSIKPPLSEFDDSPVVRGKALLHLCEDGTYHYKGRVWKGKMAIPCERVPKPKIDPKTGETRDENLKALTERDVRYLLSTKWTTAESNPMKRKDKKRFKLIDLSQMATATKPPEAAQKGGRKGGRAMRESTAAPAGGDTTSE